MLKTIIPAGYRVSVNSYEGDADNHNFLIMEGLDKRHACFYGALLSLLSSGLGLENQDPDNQRAYTRAHSKLLPIFETYADLFTAEELADFKEDVGLMLDVICEKLIGYPADYYAMRYVETFKIEYVPQAIELQDVTEDILKAA